MNALALITATIEPPAGVFRIGEELPTGVFRVPVLGAIEVASNIQDWKSILVKSLGVELGWCQWDPSHGRVLRTHYSGHVARSILHQGFQQNHSFDLAELGVHDNQEASKFWIRIALACARTKIIGLTAEIEDLQVAVDKGRASQAWVAKRLAVLEKLETFVKTVR